MATAGAHHYTNSTELWRKTLKKERRDIKELQDMAAVNN